MSHEVDMKMTAGFLNWRKLNPLGVEIERDLSKPLSPDEASEFARLLWNNGLILARGQSLSMERQRELCSMVGPILLRAGENGYLSTETGIDASLAKLSWHSDAAYTDAPFDALSLHAVDVVDGASSTGFVSAEDAYSSLPVVLRRKLKGKRVEMIAPSYDAISGRSCDLRNPVAQKRGERPAIYTNPHNGRPCIWVNELQATRVLGMEWEDSRNLLHAVYDSMYQRAHIYEHRWHNGDFVIWDNIALQHMRAELTGCGKRVLQRVIVGTGGVSPHIQTM